jgi:hypothetical protein
MQPVASFQQDDQETCHCQESKVIYLFIYLFIPNLLNEDSCLLNLQTIRNNTLAPNSFTLKMVAIRPFENRKI